MSWCLMSSDVSWHIRDKLWPMPNKSLRPRKPEGSLGRTAQDVHLNSHTAPELYGSACAHAHTIYNKHKHTRATHKTVKKKEVFLVGYYHKDKLENFGSWSKYQRCSLEFCKALWQQYMVNPSQSINIDRTIVTNHANRNICTVSMVLGQTTPSFGVSFKSFCEPHRLTWLMFI